MKELKIVLVHNLQNSPEHALPDTIVSVELTSRGSSLNVYAQIIYFPQNVFIFFTAVGPCKIGFPFSVRV